MLVFQNLLFYNIIFLIGRGIATFLDLYLKGNIKNKYFGIPAEYLYPLFTFFILGNLSFLLNFFVPLKNNLVLLVLTLFIFFNFRNKKKNLTRDQILVSNFIIPIILSISSISVGFHYDSPLYHLNTQNWIINEKIVLGISNIYLPLGFATMNEYLLSNFWIQNNFIFHHFVNLCFLNILFSIIYFFIFKSKSYFYKYSGIFIIVFGFLDNFGLNGGRNGFFNIQGIGKVDNNFAVVFLLACVFLIELINENDFQSFNLFVISNFVLFSIQLKVYGYGLVIIYLFYLYLFCKNKNLSLLKIKSIRLPLILGSLWLFKNFLKTSCIIYPVDFLCIKNTGWYSSRTPLLSYETREFHNAFSLDQNILLWFEKFSSKEVDYFIIINFFISYLFIYMISKLIFHKNKIDKKLKSILIIFTIFNLLLFLFTAPTPRFLIGLFVFIVAINGLGIYEFKYELNTKLLRYAFSFIFFITIALIPRLTDYESLVKSLFQTRELVPKEIEYVDNVGWGVRPIDGEQCWINLNCSEADSFLKLSLINSYTVISLDE